MNKLEQVICKALTGYCPSVGELILWGCRSRWSSYHLIIKKCVVWTWSEWSKYVIFHCEARAKEEEK